MKKWLGWVAVIAALAAGTIMIFVFANTNAGTAARFRGVPTSTPLGTCYVNSASVGVKTKQQCTQQYTNWSHWCLLPVRSSDPSTRCDQNQSTSVSVCSRTTNDTTYGPAETETDCGGASYNRFYPNCKYLPGNPPYNCTGSEQPPPINDYRSPGGTPGSQETGICARTTNTTTYSFPQTYDSCTPTGGKFYERCRIVGRGSPGTPPWQCD